MDRLNLRLDPVRLLLSKAVWASGWYLACYLFIGSGLFAIALTAATVGAAISFTLAGLPVLLAAAVTIRWCADAERARLKLVDAVPVVGRYRSPAGGLLGGLRTRWSDPATWHDIAYLIGLYVPLFILDTIVLAIWLTLLAGITIPVWYWAPWQTIDGIRYHGYQLGYFPNGRRGPGGWGLYVDSLPRALLVAAVCLITFLFFNYALVATARAHAFVVRALLGEPTDPLKEAKEILSSPGPLSAAEAAGRPVV